MKEKIINNILKKKLKVGIIGLGFVGLPLLRLIRKKKIDVYGFDENHSKIKKIKKNISYISDITNDDLLIIDKKKIFNTSELKNISSLDIIIICLPTPLKKNISPDMSYIKKCFNQIFNYLRSDQTLILESTVYPGATKDLFFKRLIKKFKIGKDFFIGYSPERINPGVKGKIQYSDTTKVVSGYSSNCKKIVKNFYKLIFKKVHTTKSIEIAELSKLYENVYRSVNIGLANQIKMITDKMKINIHDVINASSTKQFGFTKFIPGPGMGGHCIPIDPLFLSWAAKKNKSNTKFIDLARQVNLDITKWINFKILKYLKKNNKKKILLIGMAYKKNVNDDRESPSKIIFKFFKDRKFKINYYDPLISIINIEKKIFKSLKNLNKKKLLEYDVIVVGVDHDIINFDLIYNNSKFIFDTRGVYSNKISKNLVHC